MINTENISFSQRLTLLQRETYKEDYDSWLSLINNKLNKVLSAAYDYVQNPRI